MAIGNIAQLTLFSLIMMRMTGFVLLNPVLGRRNIPARVKAGFIFILTLMIYSFSVEEAFEIGSTIEFAASDQGVFYRLCSRVCHAFVFFYCKFCRLYHRFSDGVVDGYRI